MRVLSFTAWLFVVATAAEVTAQTPLPPPVLSPCTVAGVTRPTECGTIDVPERRSDVRARSIRLYVVVAKAAAHASAVPVLFFAGGPGQGAATLAATIVRDLDAAVPDRDIILIDQRGTGRSNLLTCPDGFLLLDPSRVAELKQCAATLQNVAELNAYGTDESAADAADVLRALGHTRVDVVAASYGTRLALRFMQRYPALVRTAVLRAVAPYDYNILEDGATHARHALARVLVDCRADVRCSASFPALEQDLENLRQRLRATREPISAELLERTLYAMLLSTTTRQAIPLVIHTAATKDTTPLANMARTIEGIYKTVAVGAYLSVVCAEDAPLLSKTRRRGGTHQFDAGTAAIVEACRVWPVTRAERPERKRLKMPTLVVSGELDPAMPASVGVEAQRDLANSKHLVLPATAHGPMFPGCAIDLVRNFIASNGTAATHDACLGALTLPPFQAR